MSKQQTKQEVARAVVSVVHRDQVPGTPNAYDEKDLAVVKEMLKQTLDNIGGIPSIVHPNDSIFIKVNAVSGADPGANTDPRVVEALIRLLHEESQPGKIVVGELSHKVVPNPPTSLKHMELSGIFAAARRAGAEVVGLEDCPFVEVNVPNAKSFRKFRLPKIVMDSDLYFVVPKMKIHLMTQVTLSLKCQIGLLTQRDKERSHNDAIHQKIVDMLRAIRPDLAIIDGIWAMQRGPFEPESAVIKDMNVLVAGKDAVAVDAVGSKLMGFDPFREVPHIRAAHHEKLGVGDLRQIDIKGDRIDKIARNFERGLNDHLVGAYPEVDVYVGGACVGCLGPLRNLLDKLEEKGKLKKIGKMSIVVGACIEELPNELEKPVFVVGSCTSDHSGHGMFLSGCTPITKIWSEIETEIDRILYEREHSKKEWKI